MKQMFEEAARDYMDIPFVKMTIKCSDIEDLESHIKVAFLVGAKWQSKQSPWINVNERLPDNDDDLYFVLDTKLEPPACGVCDFDLNMHKWVGAGGIILHPTHWMPVPKINE